MYIIIMGFFFLLVGWNAAFGQLLDTSAAQRFKPVEVYALDAEEVSFFNTDSTQIDTQLNSFSNYYPAYQANFPFIDLGLEASPLLPLSQPLHRKLSLELGMDGTIPLFFDDNVTLYHTDRPFTRLRYSQGPNEMLQVEVSHAQQISERLTFGLDYRRIKNQNLYFSNIQNIARARLNSLFNSKFYVGYYTPDRKYELVAAYLWNKSDNVETNGIVSDSTFNSLPSDLKSNNSDVLLTDASGIHARNSFNITQYYRPGKPSKDTTERFSLRQYDNQFYLTTHFDNNRIQFMDESPEPIIYGDTLDEVNDSFYHRTLSNEFGYVYNYKTILLKLGLQHAYEQVYLNGSEENFQNIYGLGQGKLNYKTLQLDATAKLGLLGYNLGDYEVNGRLKTEYRGFSITAQILSQLVEPTYIESNFQGSSLSWTNDFQKIAQNSLSGRASYSQAHHNLSFKITAETSSNPVYLNNLSTPVQFDGTVSLLTSTASYSLARPHFGIGIDAIFQNSSNQIVLPRPATSIAGNIYTNFNIFKDNLKLQLGAKTFWMSEFKSPRYNPFLRTWYNADKTFIPYPPIRLYLNGKVKSFCIGLEFFHIQEGFMGNEYYSSPSYPMLPRSFRLHLRWDLSN